MSRATTFATTTTNTERHTAAGETAPAQPSILNTNTPSRSKPSEGTTSGTQPSHRLLYRGALSLSDSLLVLDGLSFTTEIAERGIGSSPSTSLLENPLILALESMRGRNLHLLGTVDLNKVWLDRTRIDISVYAFPEGRFWIMVVDG